LRQISAAYNKQPIARGVVDREKEEGLDNKEGGGLDQEEKEKERSNS